MTKTVGFYGGKFSPIHLGHVYAMTVASSMVDELNVVVCYDEEWEKEAHSPEKSKVPYIHHDIRSRWWKEITKEMKNVKVHVAYNKNTMEMSDWVEGAEEIKDVIGRKNKITHVFSSESHYGEYFERVYEGSKHVIIDEVRTHYPISATYLRKNGVYNPNTWNMIPKIVQQHFVKKVVLVGLESSGKSTLGKHLARIYNTEYVEETGRTFYEEKNDFENFYLSDYIEFTHRQKDLERKAKSIANRMMFIDTEALTTLRFSRQYNDTDLNFLKAVAETQQYDLWLYLNPDIPFVEDGTRGYVKEREKSDKMMRGILDEFGINYHEISGNFAERLKKSSELVDNLLTGDDVSAK